MARYKLIIFIIVTMLLSACATNYATFRVDQEFTARENILIRQAVDHWNYAVDTEMVRLNYDQDLGAQFSLKWLYADDGFAIIRTNSCVPEYDKIVCMSDMFIGLASPTTGKIAIVVDTLLWSKRDYGKEFVALMLHELGHLAGLDHEYRFDNMMRPGLHLGCIDEYSINKICDMNECGENPRPTCPPSIAVPFFDLSK